MAGIRSVIVLCILWRTSSAFMNPTPNCATSADGRYSANDPHAYYVCSDGSLYTYKCPAGFLFAETLTVSGCVNERSFYIYMDLSEIERSTQPGPACIGASLFQPTADLDPSYYWMCVPISSPIGSHYEAKRYQCPSGQGFAANPKYLTGCIEWENWMG